MRYGGEAMRFAAISFCLLVAALLLPAPPAQAQKARAGEAVVHTCRKPRGFEEWC